MYFVVDSQSNDAQNSMIPKICANRKSQLVKVGFLIYSLVAWGGIEPPTQGFSILCSTD